ncbi:triose-phosphate isomerase [bacterium]|nr:triose-phosphate isomerase [bacterium]
MRRKVIIGNWKMFKGPQAARQLAKSLKLKLTDIRKAEVAVCPPFVSIEAVREIIKDTRIGLGAQNMYLQKSGAFTGEVSAEMVAESGCAYVIIGHSERRQYFQESDDSVNQKIGFALNEKLKPVVCLGETLSERESNRTEDVVKRQYIGAMKNIVSADAEKIIIAYEPVWAIGTGKNATPEQANEVHRFIRDLAANLYGKKFSEKMIIQYGGSVKPENANDLLSCKHIDGALVGGASLDADQFASIVRTAEKLI